MSRDLLDTDVASYELVPYPGGTFRYSQPTNVATIATLMGMKPAELQGCRVLELGCAFGKNLIPMAEAFPDATFVGVDLAKRHIEGFKQSVEQLRLKNVEPQCVSIMDVDESFGRFDYVLCHGVYSWVPAAVQDAILRVCSQNLQPHGVAYVSYNTYPGWHLRETIRHAMVYHTSAINDSNKKMEQAKAMLRFLVESVKKLPDDPYALLLNRELQALGRTSNAYLMHEHLEGENHPCYFHEFAERAAQHGLQFLSEAQMSASSVNSVDKEVRETLKNVATDFVQMEQYLDFVRNRQFRMSLLCHDAAKVKRNIDPKAVAGMYVAARCEPQPSGEDDKVAFKLANGATIRTESPLIHATLAHLNEIWPRSVAFDELLKIVQQKTDAGKGAAEADSDLTQTLGRFLLTSFLSNAVQLSVAADKFVAEVSDRPEVALSAQHAASEGEVVINRRLCALKLNRLDRKLLPKLDGATSRQELADFIASEAGEGKLEIQLDGVQMGAGFWKSEKAQRYATAVVDSCLARIAGSALLIE